MDDKTIDQILREELLMGNKCNDNNLKIIHSLLNNDMPFQMWKNLELFMMKSERIFSDCDKGN
jgi:hypothetical protein